MNQETFDKIFNDYKPIQNREELRWLLDHVAELQPIIILEIGVENGGTFKYWEQSLPPNGILIGIDTNDNLKWDIKKSNRVIHFILDDSRKLSTIAKVKEIIDNEKIDFIFIDGDHNYYTVKSDYENYKQFLRPGGIIGFHDIYMQEKGMPINVNDGWDGSVTRFWNEVVGNKDELQAKTGFNVGMGIIRC